MNRVNEVTKDAFNALIQLRNLDKDKDKASDPEHIYERLRGYIDAMIVRGRDTGMMDTDIADITYALVAMADELAQVRPNGLRGYWQQRPLQLAYFGENVAGENFFARLDRILLDPARLEALVVYHMCLQLGFEGQYAVRGGERELEHVRRRVRDGLGRLLLPEPLSRRHLPQRESLGSRGFDFVVLWVGLFGLLFAMCFFVVVRITLDSMSVELAERSEATLRSLADGAPATPGEP